MARIKEIRAIQANEVLYTQSRKTSDIYHAAQTAGGQIVPVAIYYRTPEALANKDTTDVVFGEIVFENDEDTSTTIKEG